MLNCKKDFIRKVPIMLATAMTVLLGSNNVSAAADSIIVEKSSISYEYSLQDLQSSYMAHLGYGQVVSKNLYENYVSIVSGGAIKAFHDSNGYYVDYNKAVSAFINSPKTFNLNNFTQSAQDTDKTTVSSQKRVTIDANGTITLADDSNSDDFDVINIE